MTDQPTEPTHTDNASGRVVIPDDADVTPGTDKQPESPDGRQDDMVDDDKDDD